MTDLEVKLIKKVVRHVDGSNAYSYVVVEDALLHVDMFTYGDWSGSSPYGPMHTLMVMEIHES